MVSGDADRMGLADRLKARTWTLHREAERSGVLHDLLRGRAGLRAYVLLLRNLLPIYEALEHGLVGNAAATSLSAIARPELYRSTALRADLGHLAGPSWATDVAVLPSAAHYAGRIAEAGTRDCALLIPHAYVRYLGDLNGGQILKRLLGKSLDLPSDHLAFYDFPAIPDLEAFSGDFRAAIDHAATAVADVEPLLREASAAFELNIALSTAVQRQARPAAVGSGAPSDD